MEAPELLDKGDVTGAGSSSTCLFLALFHIRDRALVSMNTGQAHGYHPTQAELPSPISSAEALPGLTAWSLSLQNN